MKRNNLVRWILPLCLAVAATAAENGTFGLNMAVKLGGKSGSPLSFRIGSANVKSVVPDSPAAAATVAAGDELVEVDGLAVPGCKGLTLKAKLSVPPGTKVSMKFKRPNGEAYSVELTSVSRKR